MLIFAILSCLFCFKINAIFLKNKDVSKIDSSINKEDSNNSINEVKTDLIEKENTGFVNQNIINDFETDKEKNQILNKIKIMIEFKRYYRRNKSNDTKIYDKNSNSNKKNDTTPDEELVQKEEEKHICTDADEIYFAWKKAYLNNNSYTRIFNTYDEAYKMGKEIEFKYFFGYIVQTSPTKYSDNSCEISFYTMQFFVPQGICENNPMIYLPNSINLNDDKAISSVGYLKQIGYECKGKTE